MCVCVCVCALVRAWHPFPLLRAQPATPPCPPARAGKVTRTLFLKAHINPQEFATFPVLRRMISGVEQVYKLITEMHSPGASLRLATDEALRLRELSEVRAAASQRATDNSDDEEDTSPHEGAQAAFAEPGTRAAADSGAGTKRARTGDL